MRVPPPVPALGAEPPAASFGTFAGLLLAERPTGLVLKRSDTDGVTCLSINLHSKPPT